MDTNESYGRHEFWENLSDADRELLESRHAVASAALAAARRNQEQPTKADSIEREFEHGKLYDEDGYCIACGNGRWKFHMPKCEIGDLLDELRNARQQIALLEGALGGPIIEARAEDTDLEMERKLMSDPVLMASLAHGFAHPEVFAPRVRRGNAT